MNPLPETALLLVEEMSVAAADFLDACGLDAVELDELVAVGVFAPIGATNAPAYPASALATARSAARLRSTFDLTPEALALVMRYRSRILELERRVRELECQVTSAQPRYD